MKKITATQKVILEFYMEIWYCYAYENGSMANPLFTSTSYELADAEAKDAGYEVVQVIERVVEGAGHGGTGWANGWLFIQLSAPAPNRISISGVARAATPPCLSRRPPRPADPVSRPACS